MVYVVGSHHKYTHPIPPGSHNMITPTEPYHKNPGSYLCKADLTPGSLAPLGLRSIGA